MDIVLSTLMLDCYGITLGSLRCQDLEYNYSDIEMYFYTYDKIQLVSDITKCLIKLKAKHKRRIS